MAKPLIFIVKVQDKILDIIFNKFIRAPSKGDIKIDEKDHSLEDRSNFRGQLFCIYPVIPDMLQDIGTGILFWFLVEQQQAFQGIKSQKYAVIRTVVVLHVLQIGNDFLILERNIQQIQQVQGTVCIQAVGLLQFVKTEPPSAALPSLIHRSAGPQPFLLHRIEAA